MELLNINSLASGMGYALGNLPLKKASFQMTTASGQASDAAFKLGDLQSQGLIESFSVSSGVDGVMDVEVVFPDNAPVAPEQSQSTGEPVEAEEV